MLWSTNLFCKFQTSPEYQVRLALYLIVYPYTYGEEKRKGATEPAVRCEASTENWTSRLRPFHFPSPWVKARTVQALNMSLSLKELIWVWFLNRSGDPPGDTAWGTRCTQGWVNSLWAQWTRHASCPAAIHWGLFLSASWVNIFKRSQIERGQTSYV